MLSKEEARKLSDENLVKKTLTNQDIYAYLMDRYEEPLLRYIKRLTSVRDEEAEDILQDVFIKAYQNLNSFDRALKFSSWIYRICHNEVISYFRKRKARPEVIVSIDDEVIVRKIAAEVDLEKEMDLKLKSEATREVVKKLDKKYRDVLILKYLEDKSYEEIAEILKKPTGTIGTLISRAKKIFAKETKKLRNQLK